MGAGDLATIIREREERLARSRAANTPLPDPGTTAGVAPPWLTPSGVAGATGGVGGSTSTEPTMGQYIGSLIDSGEAVYAWSDGSNRTEWGTIVADGTWSPTGTAPPRGSGAAARVPDVSKPEQDAQGNWFVWQYPPDGGPPVMIPVDGPETGGDTSAPMQGADGSWGVWKTIPGTDVPIWEPIEGGPSGDQSSTKDPRFQYTDSTTGTIWVWDTAIGDYVDTGKKGDPPEKGAPVRTGTGSLIQYDPVTDSWTEIAPAPPKDTSAMEIASMQIAANSANSAAGRAHDAAMNADNNALQWKIHEANLADRGLDRDLTRELAEASDALARELEVGRQRERHEDRRLEAQKAFADAVNTVDPSALPAFLAAGGGTAGGGDVVGSVGQGGNAITQQALLPAARMLQMARTPFQGVGTPAESDAVLPVEKAPMPTPGTKGLGGMSTGGVGGGVPSSGAQSFDETQPLVKAAGGFSGSVRTPTTFVVGENGAENVKVAPYRRGGGWGGPNMTPGQGWDSFDSPAPAPPPTEVSYGDDQRNNDVNTTPAPPPSVVPPAAPPVSFQPPPTGPGGVGVTEEDKPWMKEVMDIRTGVDLPEDVAYLYNLDYSNQSPEWQQFYLKGLQAKYGAAAGVFAHGAAQQKPLGQQRSGVGVRY